MGIMADFPDVFVKSMLIAGADDLKALISSGEFMQILAPSDGQNKKGSGSQRTQPLGMLPQVWEA